MSRFDDFLQDDPPPGHTQKVLLAVQPELERNASRARQQRRGWWVSLVGLGLATAGGLVFWNRSTWQKESELQMAAFQGVELDDLELLAETDDEFLDLLEDLDQVEGWEET